MPGRRRELLPKAGVLNWFDQKKINEKFVFIALIHPIQWTIALLVGATRPAIASFSFGVWSVRTCFQQETFF